MDCIREKVDLQLRTIFMKGFLIEAKKMVMVNNITQRQAYA
jgi:hypothetical protein